MYNKKEVGGGVEEKEKTNHSQIVMDNKTPFALITKRQLSNGEASYLARRRNHSSVSDLNPRPTQLAVTFQMLRQRGGETAEK